MGTTEYFDTVQDNTNTETCNHIIIFISMFQLRCSHLQEIMRNLGNNNNIS